MADIKNGFIHFNGQPIQVFDDSDIRNAINAVIDPETNRIRPSALPDRHNNGTTINSNIGKSYTIELDRWGIKPGLPAKPYTTDQYQIAFHNVQGINNAMEWAIRNGFNDLILPKDEYTICYPYSINIKFHNLTFDFSSSTLKVIYDSERKSPFDPRNSATDYFSFPGPPSGTTDGIAIVFQEAKNCHVKNLTLIGDKADRSFVNPAEIKIEWTHGIQFTKSSSYCKVSNCTISSFMGDGININNYSQHEFADLSLGLTPNEVDSAGSLIPLPSDHLPTLISKLISLPTTAYDSFLVAGYGYNRLTSLNKKEVDVIYYDADNTFIARYSNKNIYTPISIPTNAKKFRILFHNETNQKKNMNITLKYGLSPHHNKIENNEIYNIHRGGIHVGGNYTTVCGNTIHDGTGLLDGKPLFNSTTRYGINQEDAYGNHSVIRDNQFYNLHHGILIGCWSAEIHNNHFYNLTGIAVNIYNVHSINVNRNYMYHCLVGVGLMSTSLAGAHVFIENNTFANIANQTFNGNGYDLTFERNTLIDVLQFSMQDNDRQVCRSNKFLWTASLKGIPMIIINRVETSLFIGIDVQREIYMRVYEHVGSVFHNVHARLETRDQTHAEGMVTIRDCKFSGCTLSNWIFQMKKRQVRIVASKLIDTILRTGIINTPNQSATLYLADSSIVIDTIPQLIQIHANTGHSLVDIVNSKIEINNAAFRYFVTSVFQVTDLATVKLVNNAITFTGEAPLTQASYYDPSRRTAIRTFINAHNRWRSIVLDSGEPGRYLEYNPETEGMAPPTSGYWFKGDTYKHASPTPGGSAGWICIASGFAGIAAWKPSTAINIGDHVLAGGIVYEAATAGTTGTTAPVWPATPTTVTDNGVTWHWAGVLAKFSPYAPIANS